VCVCGISLAICKRSAPHSRHTATPAPHHSIFTGWMLFMMPNQQCQSTEGMTHTSTHKQICSSHPSRTGVKMKANANKSAFSLINSAVNITLPTFAAKHRAAAPLLLGAWHPPRSINMALSSKPTKHHCSGQTMGQTDTQTPDHVINRAPHTMRATSITAAQHWQSYQLTTYNSHCSPARANHTMSTIHFPVGSDFMHD